MHTSNPFLGLTRAIPRPDGSESTYRYQTMVALLRDQHLWDLAEITRRTGLKGLTT